MTLSAMVLYVHMYMYLGALFFLWHSCCTSFACTCIYVHVHVPVDKMRRVGESGTWHCPPECFHGFDVYPALWHIARHWLCPKIWSDRTNNTCITKIAGGREVECASHLHLAISAVHGIHGIGPSTSDCTASAELQMSLLPVRHYWYSLPLSPGLPLHPLCYHHVPNPLAPRSWHETLLTWSPTPLQYHRDPDRRKTMNREGEMLCIYSYTVEGGFPRIYIACATHELSCMSTQHEQNVWYTTLWW